MDSFLDQVEELADKGLRHTADEIIGTLHPNRRHDDPLDIANDRVLAEIKASHRFNSFADVRPDNFVKWHVDGHDYMWALSVLLDQAKEAIFILDWWLTPELYLRRPPAHYPEWRLDKVLKRKAEQGVKIHVIVYREVGSTISMDSHHTKKALEALHPNIACMRHPDHIGTKDRVEFWSHHEKVVVVDNHFACIGGLDLCFGRWDTHNHPLADVHPTNFSRTLFPGQDYNNARVMDFHNVYEYAINEISILDSPRMPWHDVHMTLVGPVVLDIVQHFTDRWNEIKRRKYESNTRYGWLALPHNVPETFRDAFDQAMLRHPHLEKIHEFGHRYKQRFHLSRHEEVPPYQRPEPSTCRVQVVRSASDWSHGVLTEASIQNAYCQLIQEANHFIYIENQFFISATKPGGQVQNQIAAALLQRILRAARDGEKFKVIVIIPELPGFAGDVKNEGSLKTILAAQYRTINRGGSSIYELIRKEGFDPLDYIRFYHLRVYDRINSPHPSFISEMEKKSEITFNQARVALARQWMGKAIGETRKEITLRVLDPIAQGILAMEKKTDKTETIPIPASEEEAEKIIRKFESGAGREDKSVADIVAQHRLHDKTALDDEKWLGTEEEELNAYVSELLYIHSKVMIVDDRRVIMGSANLNDRSQKGDGDSEIALVVEDTDIIRTTMNGKPYMAARFAATLRRRLFKEHLGLIPPQKCEGPNDPVRSFMRPAPIPNDDEIGMPEDNAVADPLSDATLNLWNDTARKNREIFTELFRPIPTNLVRDWNAYENYVPKVKAGHVVPGVPLARVKEQLSQVRGSVVECPLDFLIDDTSFVEGPSWLGLDPTLPIYI